jgi:hypothetical protein
LRKNLQNPPTSIVAATRLPSVPQLSPMPYLRDAFPGKMQPY